ncbi:hypothetical protein MKX01_027177 [Papaver californicum]|nr:hypothetical protein MKX01_027177 [Papaver californicum]
MASWSLAIRSNILLSTCVLNRKWRNFVSSQEYGTVMEEVQKMVDAWGGWVLFQTLLQTLKKVAKKHEVSIPTIAVKYVLDQLLGPWLV